MPTTYNAYDFASWEAIGLEDFGDFADCVSYFNQAEDAFSGYGDWFYIPDSPLPDGSFVVYGGSYGNDNSPGASRYTYAEVYEADEEEAYRERIAELEAFPEYLPDESYSVHVSNIGTVCRDVTEEEARKEFDAYSQMSEAGGGRAGGETVTLMHGEDIEEEYEPEEEEIED